jgi:hypothetical protein
MSTAKSRKFNLKLKIFHFSETDFFSGFTVKIPQKITLTTVLTTVVLPELLPFFQQCVSSGRSKSQGYEIASSQIKRLDWRSQSPKTLAYLRAR